MARNGRTIWCVRTMPRLTTAGFERRSMRSPRKRISPDVGGSAPTRQEKSVVFPAPFGPMIPKTSPSATSKSTEASASNPPKRFERWRTESSASADMQQPSNPPRHADESLRLEEHDHDQQSAVDEEEGVAQRRDRQELDLQRAEDQRAEDRPGHGADAADDRHQHDAEAQTKVEDGARRDVLEVDRVEAPRQRHERRGDRMRGELEPRRVHADGLGRVD